MANDENSKKLEAEQAAFDRVMSEPTPEAQNAAARSLLEFMLGWSAHEAYMERLAQAQGA
jgi:hypothetical protein